MHVPHGKGMYIYMLSYMENLPRNKSTEKLFQNLVIDVNMNQIISTFKMIISTRHLLGPITIKTCFLGL